VCDNVLYVLYVCADTGSDKAPSYRFQITLVPKEQEEEGTTDFGRQAGQRNHWQLRCDTEEQLHIWLEAMRGVCPSCFR
jgi:hypothetical protein